MNNISLAIIIPIEKNNITKLNVNIFFKKDGYLFCS